MPFFIVGSFDGVQNLKESPFFFRKFLDDKFHEIELDGLDLLFFVFDEGGYIQIVFVFLAFQSGLVNCGFDSCYELFKGGDLIEMRVIEFSTFSTNGAGGGALRITAQEGLRKVIEGTYFGFDNNSVDHELGLLYYCKIL